MKFEHIIICKKTITAKEFLYETFGLGQEPCKFYELVSGCNDCPCHGFDGCAMKIIYHKLD